jgi:hypothetical protein
MRRLFTVAEARAEGITPAALRWGVRSGEWSMIERGVYVVGRGEPTPVERAVGAVLATGGVASGSLAGILLELDSVRLHGRFVTVPGNGNGRRREVRRQALSPARIITAHGVRCTATTGSSLASTSHGPNSASSSSSMASSTWVSPSTTPRVRLRWSPPPVGCVVGSHGPRSSITGSTRFADWLKLGARARRRPLPA